jgi:hypothetical protein
VVIECIRSWNGQGSLFKVIKGKRGESWPRTYDDVQKGLAFDIKWDVFDDNSRGYNLIFCAQIGRGKIWGRVEVWERRRTSTGRKIRIIRRRQGAIVRVSSSTAIEPLLREGCIWG